MAREKDEGKRAAIMAAAKRLFAKEGFHGASMSDLARETGLPVGSIYTYFENKEALVRSVIDEGWGEFFDGLCLALSRADGPDRKMAVIIYRILPGLFQDVDLISILLSEGARFADLEEKLERLTALIVDLVLELANSRGLPMAFPTGQAKAALSLYFLGSLDTVRLSRTAGLGIPDEDIIAFIRLSIENSFHISLDPPPADMAF
jgi:AcrR family transcriptional regulator